MLKALPKTGLKHSESEASMDSSENSLNKNKAK